MDTSGSGEQEQFVSRKKEKDFQGLPLFARSTSQNALRPRPVSKFPEYQDS